MHSSPSSQASQSSSGGGGIAVPSLSSSSQPQEEQTPKLSNTTMRKVVSDSSSGAGAAQFPLSPPPLAATAEEEEEGTTAGGEEFRAAPVTDKLLGLLDAPRQREKRQQRQHHQQEEEEGMEDAVQPLTAETEGGGEKEEEESFVSAQEAQENAEAAVGEEQNGATDEAEQQQESTVSAPAAATTGTSWLGSWFGGGSSTAATAAAPAETEARATREDEVPPQDSKSEGVDDGAEGKEEGKVGEGGEDDAGADEKPAGNEEEGKPTEAENDAASQPGSKESSPRVMNEEEKKHLEEAFEHVDHAAAAPAVQPKVRTRSGPGHVVAEETPIPNSDVALRLLRKFAYKTRPKISTTYGGSKARSIVNYLFGSSKEDPTFVAYRELMETLFEEGEDPDDFMKDDSDHIVDAVMGESGDSMARARVAIAAFVDVVSMWGHASSQYSEETNKKEHALFTELVTLSLDAATDLVAHGCLDDVKLQIGEGNAVEQQWAVYMIAQSVFSSDLTQDRNELAALKFLLTTGCRVTPSGNALLRGSHLLQTIRTLYHVYLTTESTPNKTTARAALQQLVTSVFTRVVQSDAEGRFERTPDNFVSENHRDAFLVMRAICKLSMRNLPDPKSGMQGLVGLQTSGSSDTWDGGKASETMKNESERTDSSDMERQREQATLLYTAAIHPALESKLLALELLLYLLQRTNFSKGFIQRCGPQFHAAVRNYLCVSLLKNCTSDDTRVVNLSLRIFVPLVRNFRTVLKSEIEAFVTNVFFVILDSANTPAEHKSIVVKTFDEICSDPSTLAEIFLNYDCDLSAVDLFHRIVNTLSKVSMAGFQEPKTSGMSFMGGSSAARMEKFRNENRELRLDAMRALRQVLASLHASIVEPLEQSDAVAQVAALHEQPSVISEDDDDVKSPDSPSKQNLVEIYDSKKKRRAEESEVTLRFGQKPSAGISFAAKCGHVDGEDPADVARYLLKNKDVFDKTQIGEYLGREPDYQNGFSLKVLHAYVGELDLEGLPFDEAIRYFLSGFRLPGEAQKVRSSRVTVALCIIWPQFSHFF